MSQTTSSETTTSSASTTSQTAPFFSSPDLSPEKLKEKFEASIILAAVGDIIGYRKGSWEFTFSGAAIHRECNHYYGGVEKIKPTYPAWIYSDDTVMHYATIEALVAPYKSFEEMMQNMAKEYIKCWSDMDKRAPGPTTAVAVKQLASGTAWNKIAYNKSGGGCGGSMRAMAIGLRFYKPEDVDMLIATSIESGRLTHNHSTGFLGALVSAVFTTFAVNDIPPRQWGKLLLDEVLPRARVYLRDTSKRDWNNIREDMVVFETKFREYLKLRNIEDGNSKPKFPSQYGIEERDEQYKKWSYAGWGGASGDDSCIIAYDALLGSEDNWIELLNRAALHGGDSDSTATISGAWFGALYGYKGVPKHHHEGIEREQYFRTLAKRLLEKSTKV